MDGYLLVKLVHILSSAVLLGAGVGTLLQGWSAHPPARSPSRGARLRYWLPTGLVVLLQPVTGIWLARITGFSLADPWLAAAVTLYPVVGLCAVAVLGCQRRMRRIAADDGARSGYARLARARARLGWAAFTGMLVIFWLMMAKPGLW